MEQVELFPILKRWCAAIGSPEMANVPAVPIDKLAEELLANRNLLGNLAGPTVAVTVDVEGEAQPVRLTGEDLTRILVNLVKNASEAIWWKRPVEESTPPIAILWVSAFKSNFRPS
jgi:hypothetical protein